VVKDIPSETLIKMFQVMMTIRRFEEKAKELYLYGLMRGTLHLSIGEEATSTGVCLALEPDDYIMTTHRGHGHCIAKGVDVDAMMAEILGKDAGCCQGRGGTMHIFDVSRGVLGANAIVGGNIPLSTGVAFAIQQLGLSQVIVSFFGDGACNQGTFHESLNMGALWKLPVIYVIVNNQVGDTTPLRETVAVESLAIRARGYGMPGVKVDGNDVLQVYARTAEAVERARSGDGPTLIECETYRWEGHHLGDPQVYRTKVEVEEWKRKDPIARLRQVLLSEALVDQVALKAMEDEIEVRIEAAVKFAQKSPEPDPSRVLDYVWA